MTNLIIAPVTGRQLEAFTAQPAHAVRLVGPAGSGKLSLAQSLSAQLLQLDPQKLANSAYFKHLWPNEGKAIGIEEARQITDFLALKVPSQKLINRVVLVENSHLLTTEAQSALLKTLEEPPAGTVLVMTTADDQSLLPTIRSRSQQINVQRPAKELLESHFGNLGHSIEAINKAYAMSGGLPGLMQAILSEDEHAMLTAANLARQLLGRQPFERLTMVDELIKDRQLLEQTVAMLGTMAEIGLQSASGNNAVRWQSILTQSYLASERLQAKAQPKLVVDELLLTL